MHTTAQEVVSITGQATQDIIFGYESGATMLNSFAAPGRRVGCLLLDASAAGSEQASREWIRLASAAIAWAVDSDVALDDRYAMLKIGHFRFQQYAVFWPMMSTVMV